MRIFRFRNVQISQIIVANKMSCPNGGPINIHAILAEFIMKRTLVISGSSEILKADFTNLYGRLGGAGIQQILAGFRRASPLRLLFNFGGFAR